MTPAVMQLSHDLRQIHTVDGAWDRMQKELSRFGVESMFYGAAATRQDAAALDARLIVWKSNHPQAYFDAFGVDHILENDLLAMQILEHSEPIRWHDDALWNNATPQQTAKARIEADLGLNVGVVIPASHFEAYHLGGISLSTPALSPRAFDRMWAEQSDEIITVCGLLDACMRETYLAAIIHLSPREIEVLTWLASGLRPSQIAGRLKIGSHSVDKYINSARAKLHAKTRDHAVAKALIYNIIHP